MSAEEVAMRHPLLPVKRRSSWRWSHVTKAGLALVLLAVLFYGSLKTAPTKPSKTSRDNVKGTFTIANDRFVRDGVPMQIISGSVHYQRIHPAYWRDRLLRIRSMGLNAIQTYVPWNLHEPEPGVYNWEGFADLERFVKLAQELGLLVLLRPGPYICAEWDFGGFPYWLASSKVQGGRTMKLRSEDPNFLAAVDAWWGELLPRMRPLLYQSGGPIVMVQAENEYGFCGSSKPYLRHLVATARRHLGNDTILYTTDPPAMTPKGSLYGGDIYTVVDFGAGWLQLHFAFVAQSAMNPRGKSPPFCSEYYTGWLTHWGEGMANTSATEMVATLKGILSYAGGTGSVNMYMAHGGTNFGYWAGANVGAQFMPHITSYDYDCPVSEAGSVGQPGIGGPNKFEMIRDAVREHTGVEPPPREPPPRIAAYGQVNLTQSAPLLANVRRLAHGRAVNADQPDIMEQYGQRGGFIVYSHQLGSDALSRDGAYVLDLAAPPHDFAQVFLDGRLVGVTDRDHSGKISFTSAAGNNGTGGVSTLDVVVHALGRFNFGCVWDTKGLQNRGQLESNNITLNGAPLLGWRVSPLELEDLSPLVYQNLETAEHGDAAGAAHSSNVEAAADGNTAGVAHSSPGRSVLATGPAFYRGTFSSSASLLGGGDHPPDTFLATPGFSKGLAFINGFNLGWYWPDLGPQQTLYVPGPVLRDGVNELVLLEVVSAPAQPTVSLVSEPNFRKWKPYPKAAHPRGNFRDRLQMAAALVGR